MSWLAAPLAFALALATFTCGSNLAFAEATIGSELWMQPQVIEISVNDKGRFIFRYCLNSKKETCRFLGPDPSGYSRAQLDRIKARLDQQARSLSRNKPILFAATFLATVAASEFSFFVGSTTFASALRFAETLMLDPKWQPQHYQEIKKQIRTKDGEFYVSDIESLAQSIYALLLEAPSFEMTCICSIKTYGIESSITIDGLGVHGHWAAKMNAQHKCREYALEKTGEYGRDGILNQCRPTGMPAANLYRCSETDFCR